MSQNIVSPLQCGAQTTGGSGAPPPLAITKKKKKKMKEEKKKNNNNFWPQEPVSERSLCQNSDYVEPELRETQESEVTEPLRKKLFQKLRELTLHNWLCEQVYFHTPQVTFSLLPFMKLKWVQFHLTINRAHFTSRSTKLTEPSLNTWTETENSEFLNSEFVDSVSFFWPVVCWTSFLKQDKWKSMKSEAPRAKHLKRRVLQLRNN